MEHVRTMGKLLKTCCRSAGCGTDLFVVLWVGAVAATAQKSVLAPYLRVTSVAGSDPPEELLQFGLVSYCLLTMAVRQVFNNCSDQDL